MAEDDLETMKKENIDLRNIHIQTQNRIAVLETENKRLRKKFNDTDKEMKFKMTEDSQSIAEYVKEIKNLGD
jgi:cell shape-determining protein MreC